MTSKHRVRPIIVPDKGEPLRIIIVKPPFPWRTVMIAIGVLATLVVLGWLFAHLHVVFVMLAVAGLLAFILDPLVVTLERWMPRWAGIVVTYVGLTAVLSLAALSVVPKIYGQLQELYTNYPKIQESVSRYTDQFHAYLENVPPEAREQLQRPLALLADWAKQAVGGVAQSLLAGLAWVGKGMIMLVLSIYLLADKTRIRDGLLKLVPAPARAETVSVVGDVFHVLRAYLRGQIVVIGFVAVSVTAVLWYAGMNKYALTVGAVAGVLEVIPYFGAVVGAIPGVLYAFAVHGMWAGIAMIIFFIIINQAEGHIVIPLVMGANLEMRPLLVLLSLLVGAELGGIVGLIVAVPACRILQVFLEHGMQIYDDIRDIARSSPLGDLRNDGAESVVAAPQAAPLVQVEETVEHAADEVRVGVASPEAERPSDAT